MSDNCVAQKVTFFTARPTIQTISHEKLLMDSLSCEDTFLMHNTDVGERFVAQPEIHFRFQENWSEVSLQQTLI